MKHALLLLAILFFFAADSDAQSVSGSRLIATSVYHIGPGGSMFPADSMHYAYPASATDQPSEKDKFFYSPTGWRPSEQEMYAYDPFGNYTTLNATYWNQTTIQYNPNFRTTYTANAQGLISSKLTENYSYIAGGYIYSTLETYNYNAAGIQTYYERSLWNDVLPGWIPANNVIDVLNNQNKITESIYQYWDQPASVWITQSHLLNYYDINGLILQAVVEEAWNNVTQLYTPVARTDYYNGFVNPDSVLYSTWYSPSSSFLPLWLDVFTYDINGNNTAMNHMGYTTSGFINYNLQLKTYNSYNQITSLSVSSWTGSAWTPALDIYTWYYENFASVTDEIYKKSLFTIYPNPADDYVYIANTEVYNKSLQLTDVTGRLITSYEHVYDGDKINISNLQPGIYILTSGVQSVRFVKQ